MFLKKTQFLTFTLLLASALLLPIRVATAQLKATLEGHTDNIWSVAFSPNGKLLASASWDQTVRLWNVNTGQLLHTLTEHTNEVLSVAFSPDGQTLASSDWDGLIHLWNPRNGKLKRTLSGHAGGVPSIAFSPDGAMLASGSADRTIRLWNAKTWKLEKTLRGHTDVIDAVVFSPVGKLLASGSRDATIRLWHPNNARPIKTLTEHTASVGRLAFSPDGQVLASGSADRTVRLWDAAAAELTETLTGFADWMNPVAFSPDSATLLIGGRGISVWDTETGQYKKPLTGDIGITLSVVFSPDGQMVASGSADNKVRLWEFTASDYEIPSITTNGMVRLVYFLPNGRPIRPDRIPALRQLIKDTQQFYAEQLEFHGFGRKTLTIETDKDGEPVVHHIDGKFTEDYYHKNDEKVPEDAVWEEIVEHFDDFQHIYFVAIDVSSEFLGKDGGACGFAGIGYFSFSSRFASVNGLALRHRDITQGEAALGGMALIPASGSCFEDNRGDLHRLRATTHELGHAFGLDHDFREGQENAVVGGRGYRLSKCTAEWLSASRFFNTKPISPNTPGEIKLLSLRTYNQDAVSLHFEVTDPDGLHHAQLLVPEISEGTGSGPYRLFDCKQLSGKTRRIESTVRTAEIADRVTFQIMDMNGYITWATFPIELDETAFAQNALDVNSDGVMNLLDLTYLDARFGQSGQNPADVNEDKVVDITDVLLVAAGMSSVSRRAVETFSAADIQKWLTDVRQIEVENEFQQKGIFFLEYLLREIALSSNPTKAATSPLKATFEGHTDFVWSVTFSPDGQTLASGSRDRTVRLWNPRTLRPETILIGHSDEVISIVFSLDGQTLASGSWDRTVRLWDPSTGQLKTTLSGFHIENITSIAFSPDGQTIAGGTASNGGKHTIHLWDTDTGQYKRELAGHTDRVTSVAFNPDGETLASGSGDNTIRLWNPQTGRLKRTLRGHTNWVTSLAFSPDGQTLASGSNDRTIRLWNPNNGKLKKTLTGYTDQINPVAFSPGGETLACGGYNIIHLWDTQTGQYENTLEGDMGHILSVAFSPDGQTLASSSEDKTVHLWTLTPDDPASDNITGDVNSDGVVNILDLVLVSSNFGQTGENIADVNGDGIVNIVDLVKVAGEMGTGAAAPSADPQTLEILTVVDVQQWIAQAQHANLTDPTSQRGILLLEQLLASLIPEETSLLPNYPNPFNPETWIPYQLAEPAHVTIRIYAASGVLVRTLALGYQPAAIYQDRSRAAYWDGKNVVGESVASGIYFYTLTAGDFTATRKMLIRK